jgi:hypothetical protein
MNFYLNFLYVRQAFLDANYDFPNDIFKILIELVVWKFPWWSLKCNYDIYKNEFTLLLDREANKVMNNFYKMDQSLSDVINFCNKGFDNDIKAISIELEKWEECYQFIVLSFDRKDKWNYIQMKTYKEAQKMREKKRYNEGFSYVAILDLSEFSVGSFNENSGKARNVFTYFSKSTKFF